MDRSLIETGKSRLALEVNWSHLRTRIFEIIPAALSWGTLIALTVLAFVVPFWIAIFVIIFDIYILIRGVYMSIHLIYAYRRLRKMTGINWLERCRAVTASLPDYINEVKKKIARSEPGDKRRHWQDRQLLASLEDTHRQGVKIFPWHQVHHIVIFPTYDEGLDVLRTSLDALLATDFPKDRLHVCIGFEERVGQAAHARAEHLQAEYGDKFVTFLTTFHPDGLPGEKRVKSANANWAVQKMEALLVSREIPIANILVSNFDSDTVVSPDYFSYLTFAFITHPDRYHVSYQPLPMYNNNLWDAPAFSRVIATGSTFWQMIESTRPERLVTFSSHSMTLKALKDVGYWQADIVSEDSRIFWQCLLHYNGQYSTEPIYTSVSMDAALSTTWWKTLIGQYKQKRRWAWGIENFPFLANGFLKNKHIPRRTKWTYTFRTLEGHYSWATAPIIVAGLGWLPVLFGGANFHATVLSYSLPFTARTIMSIAMLGLLISATLTILLLPAKPDRHGRVRYLGMLLQWALFPLIATVLSSFPALDAETRLMLGRDLSFHVTSKGRRT